MPQSYYSYYGHIIFSTKNRKNMIGPQIRLPLYKYINGIIENQKGKLLETGGTENHIHLLMSLSPQISVVDTIRVIKTNSSKWVHDDLLFEDFGWQNGYAFFSVSYSMVQEIKKYIKNQIEHHKKVSFKEEFTLFLKKNNIKYAESYIWK